MRKYLFLLTVFSISLWNCAQAQIISTNQIEDIRSEINSDTLVLFNIAEVLMDTDISLGTQNWRKYVRTRVSSQVHDALTLYIFQNVPAKPVEAATPVLIQELQEQGIAVFAFTSRGRSEWYATKMDGVDLITEEILNQIGIDFTKTQLPPQLTDLDSTFGDYYHSGIIYSTNTRDKGELLREIFETTGYRPGKIVFVDDKASSLVEVESEMKILGIPFVGFAYARTAADHRDFNPVVSHIQLIHLLEEGQILSDDEAKQRMRPEVFNNIDADMYFKEVLREWAQLTQSN